MFGTPCIDEVNRIIFYNFYINDSTSEFSSSEVIFFRIQGYQYHILSNFAYRMLFTASDDILYIDR